MAAYSSDMNTETRHKVVDLLAGEPIEDFTGHGPYISDDIERKDILLKSKLRNDLNLDSLDFVEYIMDLEKAFDVTIPDKDAVKFRTVGDVVMYIEDPAAFKMSKKTG